MNIIQPAKRNAPVLVGCLICPHSSVVDGGLQFGGGGSPSLRPSAFDAHNGNVSSNSTPKQQRPTALGVTPKNSFVAKSVQQEECEVDDGSLPCTPELVENSQLDMSEPQAGDEAVESETRRLICRFLKDYTGLSKSEWSERKALSTMKRVVEDVLEKHRYAYNGMINKLSLDDRGDDMTFVSAVAKSLFSDGTTNWGRVASLVAFGAVVCQYMKDNGRGHCVELVSQEISTYLLCDQRDWLVQNNSWDGFVEFFRVADPESTVRNTLMAFAGFAGIGATLALLIR